MGLVATRLEFQGEPLLVFSHPVEAAPPGPASTWPSLSPSERAVVERLIEGWSYARIASARGVAVSTVAKQVETAYRKLQVRSRSELVARYPGLPRDGAK